MATKVRKASISRHTAIAAERAIVYRGIKIVPIIGKRSPTAEALRDALQGKTVPVHAEPAHA